MHLHRDGHPCMLGTWSALMSRLTSRGLSWLKLPPDVLSPVGNSSCSYCHLLVHFLRHQGGPEKSVLCCGSGFTESGSVLIPRPPYRTSKLKEKTSAHKREHQVLQKRKFINFFQIFRVIFALPDPDPGTLSNTAINKAFWIGINLWFLKGPSSKIRKSVEVSRRTI